MHVSLLIYERAYSSHVGGVIALHLKTLQSVKAHRPMVDTPSPRVTEVRLVQPKKADSPIVVTLLGMVTEVRPVQLEKADSPIVVKLLGIVTEARPLQLEKAEPAIPFVSSAILSSPTGRSPLYPSSHLSRYNRPLT